MHRRLRAGADPAEVIGGALDEITEVGDMGERFATAFVAVAEPDGTVTTAIWSTRTLRLAPGDALRLYTDGLTEARDAAGTQFGLGRLATEGARPAVSSAVLDHLFAEVSAYTHRPADDRSALVLAPAGGDAGRVGNPLPALSPR